MGVARPSLYDGLMTPPSIPLVWMIAIFVLLVLIAILLKQLLNAILLGTERIIEALYTFRVRQGNIARQRTSEQNPQVDAKARTTVRDSHDLPTTGRMSTGIKRVRSDRARPDIND